MEHLGQFVINHWQLWLLFIVILSLNFVNEFLTHKSKAQELSPQDLVGLMNEEPDLAIIDLRDLEQFKKGHIIHALQAKSDDFETEKMGKYKNKSLVLVCQKGLQAPIIAKKIRENGFNPVVLHGGMNAWQESGLPLIKGK